MTWRPHNGGRCPVAADTMVRPRIRVLDRSTAEKREFSRADAWVWPWRKSPGDVVEWQVMG